MKAVFKWTGFIGIGLLLIFLLLLRKNPESQPQPDNQKLKTLSYLTWVPAGKSIHQQGVIRHFQDEVFPGINFYNSREQALAHLIDMNGRLLHRWQYPQKSLEGWHHVHICQNGDLLAIIKDKALLCLNWDSDLKWSYSHRFHHDISIDEKGDIYALSRKEKWVWREGWPFPIIVDYIIVLSASGRLEREIPLYPLFSDFIPLEEFQEIYRWLQIPSSLKRSLKKKEVSGYFLPVGNPPDVLHTNALQVINRDVEGLCQKGDLLLSLRKLDMIAIIDGQSRKIRWHWGPGILQKQHHPTLLENNNILVFDNGTRKRGYTRILEMNPLTGMIVWEYRSRGRNVFYSETRGGCQRLPNGNTLITDSDSGRVFEVISSGKTVWTFFNPRVLPQKKTRAAVYRMIRLWDKKKYPFLTRLLVQ